MQRKEFLRGISVIGGTTLISPLAILQSCNFTPKIRIQLTPADIVLLDSIGETIIPTTTDSEGAKAAKIGEYMVSMVDDCFEPEIKEIFINGLNSLDQICAKIDNKSFVEFSKEQRLELLRTLQDEAIAYNLAQASKVRPLPHYFDLLKELTINGYFSSEIGMTQAREYLPLPGSYESCIDIKQGQKVSAM
ncbi:gluconate 2-dehydrogenase subunit 3 family protein [Arenibacter sp. F26102]|uniref:gluconate 2-dehydrogenase subunit 3 family protein n=1 Tax=Arenibacter sp. F26102 TaxID=2926416 RepID=UPI001FF45620|nr:gluconate 2-dehydrogenase subunit 3 family protein [Arenibacter sp. F26102]MCK0147287.1 gluconate 2-dehydrogenase subunit 3 family protein [Arenibacter sp. F26102]